MMFYAPHVAHCPLQVPKFYYDKFGFMTDDEGHCASQTVKGLHTIDPHHPELEYKCRQQYHAMVVPPSGPVLTCCFPSVELAVQSRSSHSLSCKSPGSDL